MSSFSIGQMNQLGDALERANFKAKDIANLGQNAKLLSQIYDVLCGYGKVIVEAEAIKLYDYFMSPDGSKAEGNICRRPFLRYSPYIIEARSMRNQVRGFKVEDKQVRKVFGNNLANGPILDFLLSKEENIYPHGWSDMPVGTRIFFIGTIFRDGDSLFVHGMQKSENGWILVKKSDIDLWDKEARFAVIKWPE